MVCAAGFALHSDHISSQPHTELCQENAEAYPIPELTEVGSIEENVGPDLAKVAVDAFLVELLLPVVELPTEAATLLVGVQPEFFKQVVFMPDWTVTFLEYLSRSQHQN